MSFFVKKEKVEAVLFSPLEGHLTFGGKPASGAKINLWIKWKDKVGEKYVYTADDSGYFSIPVKKVMYKDNPLAQIVITQEITVEYQGKEFLIWDLSKMIVNEYGELGGRPENLRCELLGEERVVRHTGVLMGTMCEWD